MKLTPTEQLIFQLPGYFRSSVDINYKTPTNYSLMPYLFGQSFLHLLPLDRVDFDVHALFYLDDSKLNLQYTTNAFSLGFKPILCLINLKIIMQIDVMRNKQINGQTLIILLNLALN